MISERMEKKVSKMRLKSSPFLFSAQFLFDKHLPEKCFFFTSCIQCMLFTMYICESFSNNDPYTWFVAQICWLGLESKYSLHFKIDGCHRQQQKNNPEFKWILKWQLIPIQIQACTQRERTMKIIRKNVAKQMLHKMCGFFFYFDWKAAQFEQRIWNIRRQYFCIIFQYVHFTASGIRLNFGNKHDG